jgi:hypothetical protein
MPLPAGVHLMKQRSAPTVNVNVRPPTSLAQTSVRSRFPAAKVTAAGTATSGLLLTSAVFHGSGYPALMSLMPLAASSRTVESAGSASVMTAVTASKGRTG